MTLRKRPNVKARTAAATPATQREEKPDAAFWEAIGKAQARGIDVNFHSPTTRKERESIGWIIHAYNTVTHEHMKTFHNNTNADRKRALAEALREVW